MASSSSSPSFVGERNAVSATKRSSINSSTTNTTPISSTPAVKSTSTPASSGVKKRKEAPSLPRFHLTSEWLEPFREDGLTLYEIHRLPRSFKNVVSPNETSDASLREGSHTRDMPDLRTFCADPSPQRLRRSLKVMASEFRCAICMEYITNARIVVECLHRFCEACVEMSLRRGFNQCPICRKSMSRRSLPRGKFVERKIHVYV
jgi:Zinc finger, C3HC4 type (RING finger)